MLHNVVWEQGIIWLKFQSVASYINMLWTNVCNCASLWAVERLCFTKAEKLLEPRMMPISSRWTHSISLSLNAIFFLSTKKIGWISVALFVFFLTFYLFIYLFFIVLDFLNWFCFCLGLAGNFYMTGFTKSIYFRARFVCISWVLIQSLQYADLYIHKLLMINVYFFKLQDMAIKFRN